MAQVRNRDYEVSIWTLQDEFISVLKPTGVVNKGQIEKPNMKIVDDGTQEFTFSIPMYIISNGQRVENPIWKNTRDGNIIADMRKIKVTFNRGRSKEKTFEFLITDVTERHENDQLYCDVNCEGMAFHELGKRGYSIKLLTEDFYLENERYFSRETGPSGKLLVGYEPKPTLSYWLNKFLPEKPIVGADPRLWYYKIEMDWSGYAKSAQRKTNEVYEEEYVSSWKLQQDSEGNEVYAPNQVEALKVKERLVDLKESNIYNLTQDLAETFGVFCRYEYEHDDNLEITGRTVVFYNNYMREREGYIDITYPFETAAITRTRDSKDLTTKMFVTSVEDENAAGGVLTIMDVDANKSREEYLLNFDYLYSIGSITAEQYQEIPKYEAAIGKINIELGNIAAPLLSLQNQITDLEAEITIRKNSIDAAKEAYSNLELEQTALTNGTGKVTRDANNPIPKSVAVDKNNNYYITFSEKGVFPESIQVYKKFDANGRAQEKLSNYSFEYEGNTKYVSKVFNLNLEKTQTVYVTCSYNPWEYYDTIKATYRVRQQIDETALKTAETKLSTVNGQIKKYQIQQEKLLADKQELIKKFDDMMGAAIRESYWQPENYDDYGDNYTDNLAFNSKTTVTPKGSSGLTQLVWDTNLFQDEQKAYYEESVNLTEYYYPVIKIPTDKIDFVRNHYDELSIIFYDFDDSAQFTPDKIRQFTLGSTAQYGFIKDSSSNVQPVIILTGADSLIGGKSFEGENDNINTLKRLIVDGDSHGACVGVVNMTVSGKEVHYSINKGWDLNTTTGAWANYDANAERYTKQVTLVYPRIKIGSLSLKTSEDQLAISYYGETLKNNDDYYILTRDDSQWNSKNELEVADSAYYITLKPETMIRLGTYTGNVGIRFCISNANVSIYLDALQVMKENSQPKVSYTVDVSFVDFDFIYDLYNKLNRICNINDHELHFENVQGYISEINLDCDVPANDSIEVKNYKTKFEDLFSTIVAQTQSMKKSEYAIGLATSAFTVNGDLADKVMESSWRRMDLNLAFNKGKLTINEADGIWGMSEDGVVAFRGGGIFTATKKDDLGNWIWNTGILPQGINADLITTGRLDTNKINIYSGDNVRFQFNGDGIFAYRDYTLVNPNYATIDSDLITKAGITTENSHQFVTMNQEGVFLVAEEGAKFLVGDEVKTLGVSEGYVTLRHINRVSMSWDGFTIRDWNNDRVLYADTNGKLTLKGTVYAKNLYIGGDEENIDDYILDRVSGTIDLQKIEGAKMVVDAQSGLIDILSSDQINIASSGNGFLGFNCDLLIQANKEMTLLGGSKLTLLSSTIAIKSGAGNTTNNIFMNTSGITLDSTAKIVLQGTGGIELNSGNITMSGGTITMSGGTISLYTKSSDNTDIYTTQNNAFTISNVKNPGVNDYIYAQVSKTGLYTPHLHADRADIEKLIINGEEYDPSQIITPFSNKEIVYTESVDIKPTKTGVIWIYPTTSSSYTPPSTRQTITWTSGTIGTRVSLTINNNIAKYTETTNVLRFNNGSSLDGTTSPYNYTAVIHIYCTGTGTRTVYKKNPDNDNQVSNLKIGDITLSLQNRVTLASGAKQTLTFSGSSINNKISKSEYGALTLYVSSGNTYINLDKDKTNELTIQTSDFSQSASATTEIYDCVVKYIK